MTEEAYEEQEDDGATPRGDEDYFCSLLMRKVLIVNGLCYSRSYSGRCEQCRFDGCPEDRIRVRLTWILRDMLIARDRAAEETEVPK